MWKKRMLIRMLIESDLQDDLVVLLVEKISTVRRLTLSAVVEIGLEVARERLQTKGVSVEDARKEVEAEREFMNPLLYWISMEVLDRM